MLERNSGVSSPHKTRKIFISIYVREHLIFKVQPPRSPELSPLDFYVWGHLKTTVYSDPNEKEEISHQFTFYAYQSIRNRLGTFEIV
jgi:hypothetical protein